MQRIPHCQAYRSAAVTPPRLQAYANRHGDSGVTAWAIHGDTISVEFGHGAVYVYAARELGAPTFDALCRSARAGRGLATMISRDIGTRDVARFENRAQWAHVIAQATAPSKR